MLWRLAGQRVGKLKFRLQLDCSWTQDMPEEVMCFQGSVQDRVQALSNSSTPCNDRCLLHGHPSPKASTCNGSNVMLPKEAMAAWWELEMRAYGWDFLLHP